MGVMSDLFDDLRSAHRAYYDAERLRDARLRAWKKGCAEYAGCDEKDLEFTNIHCSSSFTFGHVYKWRNAFRTTSIGNRVCIFCKLDDFDF